MATSRQLDALAEKLESESHLNDLAKTSGKAAHTVHEWLAVLARCFHLHDALAVLELDRVLDAAPDELERHSIALTRSRRVLKACGSRCVSAVRRSIICAVGSVGSRAMCRSGC